MNEEEVVRQAVTPKLPDRLYRLTPVIDEVLRNEPEFIRLPKPRARCPYSSLSRTTLIEHLPHIRHVRLRKEGSTRSIILVHLPSLREFLEARMSTPKPAPVNKRKSGTALV
jgi:hypothetical protein